MKAADFRPVKRRVEFHRHAEGLGVLQGATDDVDFNVGLLDHGAHDVRHFGFLRPHGSDDPVCGLRLLKIVLQPGNLFPDLVQGLRIIRANGLALRAMGEGMAFCCLAGLPVMLTDFGAARVGRALALLVACDREVGRSGDEPAHAAALRRPECAGDRHMLDREHLLFVHGIEAGRDTLPSGEFVHIVAEAVDADGKVGQFAGRTPFREMAQGVKAAGDAGGGDAGCIAADRHDKGAVFNDCNGHARAPLRFRRGRSLLPLVRRTCPHVLGTKGGGEDRSRQGGGPVMGRPGQKSEGSARSGESRFFRRATAPLGALARWPDRWPVV